MVTLEEYLLLAVAIGFGAFLRQGYVFFRKNGLDWSKFRPEETIDTFISLVITTISLGLVNEFLSLGLDLAKPLTWLSAIFYGIVGQDVFHQLRAKANEKTQNRLQQ